MFRPFVRALLASGVLALSFSPALAQATLSEDEIAQRFKGQQGEALTRSIKQEPLHRGLVIAPSSAAAANAETAAEPLDVKQADLVEVEYKPASTENQVNIQISFDLDSTFVREDQKPKLASLCNVMASMTDTRFRIIGHTDASGSATYNDTLSVGRADAVRRYLQNDCGIPAERLEAIGVGERYPANEANPAADENRRVEFQAIS